MEALTQCQNGKKASARYFDQRKGTLSTLLKHAVVKGELDDDPLHHPRLGWQRPNDYRAAAGLDPREVGTRDQVESLLAAVSYTWPSGGSYVAFLGCLYYGMMRPEEDVRIVPIPPRLVELINSHVDHYGAARGGALFRSATGRKVSPGTVWLLCKLAREYAFGPGDWQSSLLHRPHSLRHSGISLRLYAGVPPLQVAAWAGHSVEVLMRIYANVIAGYETRWQGEIDDFLAE